MTEIDDVARDYMGLRPASRFLGRSEHTNATPPFVTWDEIKNVHIYEIRSLAGGSFTTSINGDNCIFLDEIALEDALHYFDLANTDDVDPPLLHGFWRGMGIKRLSRILYSIGNTVEAFATVLSAGPMPVSFMDGTSELTKLIRPGRRSVFQRNFVRFALGHELAHIAQSLHSERAKRFREFCTDMANSLDIFSRPKIADRVIAALNKSREEGKGQFHGVLDDDTIRKHLTLNKEEVLGDAGFVDELAADLMVIDALFGAATLEGAMALAGDLMIATQSNSRSAGYFYEIAVVESIRDAIGRKGRDEHGGQGLSALQLKALKFLQNDLSRFREARLHTVRMTFAREFIKMRLGILCEQYDPHHDHRSLAGAMDAFAMRTQDAESTMMSPVDYNDFRLLYAAFSEGDRYRAYKRAQGYSDAETERHAQNEFLKMNGLLSLA